MEPPSLTREPRCPFWVMAGILRQLCLSKRNHGRLRKFGSDIGRTSLETVQFGAATSGVRECSTVLEETNDETNGSGGFGGFHDNSRFYANRSCANWPRAKTNESLGCCSRGGRQGLSAEDLGWLGNTRCGGAEAVLRAGSAR